MRKLLIIFVALSLVTGAALTAIAQNTGPDEVVFEAKMGNVTFNHAAHRDQTDCATRHHAGIDAGACRNCHGAKTDAPKAKKVFHKLCKDCHKQSKGPTKCKECHVK